MKSFQTWTLPLTLGCCLSVARAQLQLLPDTASQCVFAGDARKIAVVGRNLGDQAVAVELRARLYQTSSATTVLVNELPWKSLQMLPGQTVVESAFLDFPIVKAETRFLVQWLDGTNKVAGITEVFVYPTNLLEQLKPLAGESETGLGVLDPSKQLKPLLKKLAIKFVDFEETDLDLFSGKLAIVGPCDPGDSEGTGLGGRIGRLAKKGVAVVWIQSPPRKRARVWPSFYSVPENRASVIVVQPALIADLSGNPQSQLNLIYFCQLALHPQPPALPDLAPQPQVKL
jgi:hypothetical protein